MTEHVAALAGVGLCLVLSLGALALALTRLAAWGATRAKRDAARTRERTTTLARQLGLRPDHDGLLAPLRGRVGRLTVTLVWATVIRPASLRGPHGRERDTATVLRVAADPGEDFVPLEEALSLSKRVDAQRGQHTPEAEALRGVAPIASGQAGVLQVAWPFCLTDAPPIERALRAMVRLSHGAAPPR